MISDIVSHMLQGDEVFIPEEVKVDVMNNLYAAIQKNWSKKALRPRSFPRSRQCVRIPALK